MIITDNIENIAPWVGGKYADNYYPYTIDEFRKHNVEFATILYYCSVQKSGRSSVQAYFRDAHNHFVSMFLSDFSELIKNYGDVRAMRGRWTFRKQGNNVGLVYLGP